MKKIALSLPISDRYGWGICGLNLTKALDRATGNQGAVQLFDTNDNSLLKELVPLGWEKKYPYTVGETMLHGMVGVSCFPLNLLCWSRSFNLGLCFIEDIDTAEHYVPVATSYFDHVLAGSTWCSEELRKRGFPSVSACFQGVDKSIFHPGQEEPLADKFVIGSFGKFEFRKSQDLVVSAFKKIMDKIPEAHLLINWHNPWIETMDSMAASSHIEYAKVGGTCEIRIKAIMMLNKVPANRYTILPACSHEEMAAAYRSCHVTLALSRCEAGTNLPMMEAMACGVPVIASAATGHLDLIEGISHPVRSGKSLDNGWFESDIDEVVAAIESHYEHPSRKDLSEIFWAQFTWDKMARSILDFV